MRNAPAGTVAISGPQPPSASGSWNCVPRRNVFQANAPFGAGARNCANRRRTASAWRLLGRSARNASKSAGALDSRTASQTSRSASKAAWRASQAPVRGSARQNARPRRRCSSDFASWTKPSKSQSGMSPRSNADNVTSAPTPAPASTSASPPRSTAFPSRARWIAIAPARPVPFWSNSLATAWMRSPRLSAMPRSSASASSATPGPKSERYSKWGATLGTQAPLYVSCRQNSKPSSSSKRTLTSAANESTSPMGLPW